MLDKFELIKRLTAQLDAAAEAHGALKCRLIAEMADELNALAKGLADEDKAHAAEKELLKKQIETPVRDNGDGETVGGETLHMEV